MSCNQWEHGEIKLPRGYMPKLRAALDATVIGELKSLSSEVLHAWNRVKSVPAAKRYEALQKLHVTDRAFTAMVTYNRQTRAMTVSNPSLKALRETLFRRQTRFFDEDGKKLVTYLIGGDATITLDGNTVEWHVHEGNRNADRARRHPLAQTLFDFLETVSWTARSGGIINGCDEYARDEGLGDYVICEYSRQAVRERQIAASRRGFSVYL